MIWGPEEKTGIDLNHLGVIRLWVIFEVISVDATVQGGTVLKQKRKSAWLVWLRA